MRDGASTLVDLHRRVRTLVLSGSLAPGQVVSQVQLARELGVHRATLREALRMLQSEGLIEAEHNRRVRIAPLSSADLVHVCALRIATESLAVRLTVPRLTPADDRELAELLAAIDPARGLDAEPWEAAHRTLHRRLVAAAEGRLRATIFDLQDHAHRYRRSYLSRRPSALDEAWADHCRIVEACRRRDAAAASRCLSLHLGRAAISHLAVTDPLFDPVVVREALALALPPASG